jgi:hypothetical protein
MGTTNPIVYLIKIISKKMSKEINEETAIVWRQKLEVRDKNLEAIYQSESNREKIKAIKEAWANLTEKKEKYDKSKKGVSLYDKIIKWLGAINISLKIQDTAQLSNVVLAPGIIAAKITAFIEEQKKEVAYIKRVAKTQKEIIKEDLKFYGAGLDALIDEINKGDDDYRQEILSQLDPWAQQDPYIADAPYNKIIPRYQERLGAHEIAAAKEQASGGKKLGAGWGSMPEFDIGGIVSEFFPPSSQIQTGNSSMNLGEGTDAGDIIKQFELEERILEKQRNGEELTTEEKKVLEGITTPGPVYNEFQNIS